MLCMALVGMTAIEVTLSHTNKLPLPTLTQLVTLTKRPHISVIPHQHFSY